MSKIYKEIGIGAIPVLLVFLIFLGVNIIPILFVGVLGVSLFYMIRGRGGVGISAGGGGDRKVKLGPRLFSLLMKLAGRIGRRKN